MPQVKWDSVADQTLLTTILETHQLRVDAAKVAEAWPAQDGKPKPTPRAIKERLARIKENNRLRSSSHSVSATASGTSSPVTPKKPTPRKKTEEASTFAGPSRKSKRTARAATAQHGQAKFKKGEDVPSEDEALAASPINKSMDLGLFDPKVKEEPLDSDNGKDVDWTEKNN
ncbi:uncharacterized protein N7479_003787 [Penicillium vulpinum]|uniref:Uncharacterized protein n=1 Tax=Penicillium vulpinum TaxID=29845 RepID=A0A1V6QYN0_9EURO|nr:uncharacterized protein N7479_003787 [Penicillium vulpinum]KAJ5963911.1 hypothetical protein N7479_003787 [Penicillium vulpinum]OQD94295.1 hypothetical protein PENVUL_c150G04040 [Penicillium vulpinum]